MDLKCFKKPMGAAEVQAVMSSLRKVQNFGLCDLSVEILKFMPDEIVILWMTFTATDTRMRKLLML